MRHRVFIVASVLVMVAAVGLLCPALAAAAAGGNDVGHNIGSTARHYASEIYGGVVAGVGLIFLINRRYTELGLFFIAAIAVAWLVFSPDQIADAARGIGSRILG
jgi:hypothetical protein